MHIASARTLAIGGVLVLACAETRNIDPTGAENPDGSIGPQPCAPEGSLRCDGDVQMECLADGSERPVEDCNASGKVCTDLGCKLCVPSSRSCADGIARSCDASGESFVEYACDDPVLGLVCAPDGCLGACAADRLSASHVGCEFYPTVTFNSLPSLSLFDFAVIVANPSDDAAVVTITRGDDAHAQETLPPGGAHVFRLPWVELLSGDGGWIFGGNVKGPVMSSRVERGAYRVRSNQPIVAYQFNALEYVSDRYQPGDPKCLSPVDGECYSYSNDASLLLPTHVWASEVVSSGLGSLKVSGAMLADGVAIVAAEDGTDVVVEPTFPLLAGPGIGPQKTDGSYAFTLGAGDVLQLFQHVDESMAPGSTLAGTRIRSPNDKRIQVLAIHPCVGIIPTLGANASTCDHLEETQPPLAALGQRYVVPDLAPVPDPTPLAGYQLVRVLAVAPGATTVELDPASVKPKTTLAQGEFFDVYVTGALRIDADQPIGVMHFLTSNGAGAPSGKYLGDPSSSSAVPIEQYAERYVFVAPTSYEHNYVAIVSESSPEMLELELDGVPVSPAEFTQVGSSATWTATLPLSHASEAHTASAASPFGVVVYGYGAFTSYMYPGGGNVRPNELVPR